MTRPRVFSGIQPTGGLPHVGNYVGALHNWVQMQDSYDSIYCVVDLHSMTVPYDPVELRRARVDTARMLIAVGIDPGRSLLYYQSDVPQHVELAWILSTVTGLGQLERMTQFKEKSDRSGQNLGLLSYPVLMAADILVHKAHAVPVGDDQTQHLELTRDIAERFNHRYGEEFPIPDRITPEIGARVMSLTDPTVKMSGSDASLKSRILLDESPESIIKKVKSAVTDTGSEVIYNPVGQPGISNLIELMSFFTGNPIDAVAAEYRDSGYGTFKTAVGEVIAEALRPIRERYQETDASDVERIMAAGAETAAERAEAEMLSVRERVGLS
jgi:tryptophanyl-tRNA synthetase